jgi:hypothetical protein
VSERKARPRPVVCWIARSTAAPQYRHCVIVAPVEGGLWRVHLDRLLDVCKAYDVTGLTYWQAAEEVHEILATLDVMDEWTIATWWNGANTLLASLLAALLAHCLCVDHERESSALSGLQRPL